MITSDQLQGENWDGVGDAMCTCRSCDTVFQSRGKFSGHHIAIVSITPCPNCGDHELRKIEGEWEHQSLSQKDVGRA